MTPQAPFLRWVGGKRRQAVDLAARVQKHLKPGGRYIEPFLGGGAVALAMPPQTTMLVGDACLPLGYLWWWLQREPEAIAKYAASYGLKLNEGWNTRKGYEELRAQHNVEPYSGASWKASARFLWLISACFNGLYRENSKGGFNVPWGKRKSISVPTPERLKAIAAHMKNATIHAGWDFEDVLKLGKQGDVAFTDSPYDVVEMPKGMKGAKAFTAYVKSPFGPAAQQRLFTAAESARDRGVTVIATNADTPRIRELYAAWEIESSVEQRPVAASPSKRIPAHCLIMTGVAR